MDKKKIILMVIVVILILFVIIIGILNSRSELVKAKGNTIFEKMDNALRNNNLPFNKEKVVALLVGAQDGYRYTLNDGTVFEIYLFDKDNETYNEIVSTGKMKITSTDIEYDVEVLEKQNVAIYFSENGANITRIKEMIE